MGRINDYIVVTYQEGGMAREREQHVSAYSAEDAVTQVKVNWGSSTPALRVTAVRPVGPTDEHRVKTVPLYALVKDGEIVRVGTVDSLKREEPAEMHSWLMRAWVFKRTNFAEWYRRQVQSASFKGDMLS